MTDSTVVERLSADVLVIGGGPAGTWAAIRAAEAGAVVVLADKGYTGTSGATASAGTGLWYVEDDPDLREAAIANREKVGAGLTERSWMTRVLDETYSVMHELARVQRYPFPVGPDGELLMEDLQGPECMKRQRLRVQRLGVRILDHTPALHLLADDAGVVSGAVAVQRRTGRTVRIEAGAVVLATGGCAFQSKTLGCDVDTGDGALMAVEAGALLSGMEFSNAYAIAPKGTGVTKNAFYNWATFYRADGSVFEVPRSKDRTLMAQTLLTEPVLARIDKATAREQAMMRTAQPNFFLSFDRLGIDPFTERFEITLVTEGTVRGTGGIRIAGSDCATDVPGLYAAGDTATRELIAGAWTGGGAHNASWAACSGGWAGAGAAAFARQRGAPPPATHPVGAPGPTDHREVIAEVRAQVMPYEINCLRHAERLGPALVRLNGIWAATRSDRELQGENAFRAREAAAMLAHSRWMYHAALQRTESRGMHRRFDHTEIDPRQQYRLLTGGLDELWSRPEPEWLAARDGGQAA
ncbi:FAD-binding protein [Mycolicibacterium diernhoferi]|uniref:L-aspartate oxidase n=2 Tax=Mycolicibacterium diernhoferi TaxID=1801 RepID=A0A1Q4HHL3_9MYCO|nr:FAD-binding protein [Mycolicibacterium diernhoferi]OJZ67036.1 pyridine nucleotide-disulfide oxidoreductase [Mycolicibacterium diernhoferi]PEG52540.1 pyridine nucleotide-disulfide oxidoreductase [Mycolicibacterium diernhoferi]QYL23231.1 FAD-binding protein [Mycolicibacterium diernhoferi]